MTGQLQPAINVINDYWLVAFGLIVLYFYGQYHFNTPDYDVNPSSELTALFPQGSHIISLAPPRFTTSKRRFRKYARRYIYVLSFLFILIVFFWPLFSQMMAILHVSLPSPPDDNIQSRAVWALLALTGFLSSFPIINTKTH